MSRRPSVPKRTKQFARGALFMAASGGFLLGMAVQNGASVGWTAVAVGLAGGASTVFALALLLQHLAFREPPEETPLPGEIYGKGKPAKEAAAKARPKLDGRVPFSAGKRVAHRTRDPETAKLYNQLEALNRQLQRAAVDLGLGQLSQEGYSLIVEELKVKRADVERQIARRQVAGPSGGGPGRAKA